MPQLRRINVCVPFSLLQEVDGVVRQERRSRSEFIRSAVRFYMRIKSRRELLRRMREGYPEMAQLNLDLAKLDEADAQDWARYERFLVESEPGEGKKG